MPCVISGVGRGAYISILDQLPLIILLNSLVYFAIGFVCRSLLDTETKRLLDVCCLWESVKDNAAEEIPSDAQDLILGAVGQARLLTKDKFQQFRRLVDKFEEGESQEEKMTAEDLTGFWEMVQLTVISFHLR